MELVMNALNAYQGGQQTANNRQIMEQREKMNPLLLEQQQMANRQGQIQMEGLESELNIKNTIDRMFSLERDIGFGATEEQIAQKLQNNIQDSLAKGRNPIDSQQALEALQQGGIPAVQGIIDQGKQIFQNQGFIAKPKAADRGFANIDPTKFTQESIGVYEQTGRVADLVPIAGANPDPAYIAELRGELGTTVNTLEKEANVLSSNYGKLKNLAEEMRAGNRSAVSQGLVALVKLGDPTSVVKETELAMALGAQNPVAAVGDLLRSKNTPSNVIDSVIQSLDPLNPDTVNVDEILSTADAMLQPNIQAISDSYTRAQNRGTQLSQGGYQTIFGGGRDEFFGGLNSLRFGEGGGQGGQGGNQPTSTSAVLFQAHPQHGDVTYDDIVTTARETGMSEQEVIQMIMQSAGGN